MKRMIRILSAILFIGIFSQLGFTTAAPKFPSKHLRRYVIQTPVFNPIQLRKLSGWLSGHNFDVAGMNWRKGQIEVIVDERGAQYLNSKGLRGAFVTVPGTEAKQSPDPRYLNPDSLTQKLKAIAQAYPNLTRLEQIGQSLQGRPIWALLLSDTPQANDPRALEKPSIIFDGLHHAREIMTPEIVLDVAETLLKSAPSVPRAQNILHGWQIWLVPMLNVDGNNIVWTNNSYWRKNAHTDKSDVYGVDLNRNYPYRWNGCNGSSGETYSETYRGGTAGSEPETQALVKLAEKVRPTASLSYHSFSEFVLYPYGCNGDLTPEKEMVARIAQELAAQLPSDSGSGNYTPGSPWELLYDVDGDSMDYIYASFGSLSYTFEVNQEFQPDYSVREPTLQKHRKAWIYFLNRIDKNLLTVTTVDGRQNRPATALISINTINPTKGELPYRSNVAGKYFKVLDPGNYVISAKLPDGRTAQIPVQMKGQPQQVNLVIP